MKKPILQSIPPPLEPLEPVVGDTTIPIPPPPKSIKKYTKTQIKLKRSLQTQRQRNLRHRKTNFVVTALEQLALIAMNSKDYRNKDKISKVIETLLTPINSNNTSQRRILAERDTKASRYILEKYPPIFDKGTAHCTLGTLACAVPAVKERGQKREK